MTELPLSLSVVTNDGLCARMIERGTKVPASASRVFTTNKFLPSAVMAEIVLGERVCAKDNKSITRVRVGGIKKSVGNIARVTVKLEVAEDGRLTVELFDSGSHHKKRKSVKPEKWVPEQEAADAAFAEAQKFYDEDRRIDSNSRLAGKARRAVLIADSLKRTDKNMLEKEELSEIREKAADLKKRIRLKPGEISNVDAKIIHEEIASIHKILEKVTPR